VAHKHTNYEQDKGYDVFVEVAKQLVKMHSNIHFHVVGDFDEKFINISEIKDNITFYETQSQNWFDEFYKDKDIILSPDIPSRLFTGSFEGFPNARCIEAGLHKTAIFCTDPLDLNNSYFKDNKQIVIINSTSSKIINKIEYYYNNPEDLKNICENGYKVIKDLYGFDNQIATRIRLLESNSQ
jgi:glycosyltransferase involved in cell wall biosynthesis